MISSIKKCTHKDFNEFYRLGCQMVSEGALAFAAPDRTKTFELFTHPKSVTFLAYRNYQPVGFISGVVAPFFFSHYERVEDWGFYILPDYRGSTLAHRLLRHLEKWAKEQGVTHICLGQSVGGKIDGVRRFYERSGYQINGFNAMKEL